ncbi:MCE family protein [Nocardioides panacisoli]|uniref:MCE family protein n=1 Tax=Nocardioides panacisoli TaxID=627624 RepID=UPI001C626674|nr:MlaD family protein [Nocardioides panacisoli]QYJ03847.1 MCE family protein [Nocardioides panacisoli]
MARMDKETTFDLVRLVIFGVVTTLFTGLLVMTIGNLSFGATLSYRAQFSDVTGVVEGDDVRIAGVKVGSVEDIEIIEGNRARLTFTVDEDKRLATSTQVKIRYRNLVGQRYLALTQTADGGDDLAEGDEIPIDRTEPALDLTKLFNGFKPLFEALTPDDINRLSFEVVQVFQGESGTVESLLATTASVTQTLANRDALIGDLLDNLDYALDHIADRERELTDTIQSFRTLVGGLKQDRRAILDSLDGISELSVETADLLQGLRAPLVRDIKELRSVATNLDNNKAEVDRALQVLPIKLNKIGRTATYGSWFNFYLCNFSASVKLSGDNLIPPINYQTYNGNDDHRCELP